jgi:hypothetical protein
MSQTQRTIIIAAATAWLTWWSCDQVSAAAARADAKAEQVTQTMRDVQAALHDVQAELHDNDVCLNAVAGVMPQVRNGNREKTP